MRTPSTRPVWTAAMVACSLGCGARSVLDDGPLSDTGAAGGGGAGACVPGVEWCNGLDDDCDGVVDEDDPKLGQGCDTGMAGGCGAGVYACQTGILACAPPDGTDEVCNGQDDDCDGEVDEGDPGGGGSCDTGQLGTCAAGTLHCVEGGVTCVPDAMPRVELCDGADDDCNGVIDDPPACRRRVFVTSKTFPGNFGGLEEGDALCQKLADEAALGGTYKAWLSTSKVDARDRLSHVGKPYVLVDGTTVVADDWAQFASDKHQHAINLTEKLGPPPLSPNPQLTKPIVFTGTNPDGTMYPPTKPGESPLYTCDDWTGTALPATEVHGNPLSGFAGYWTKTAAGHVCGDGAALYCLEQ